LWGVREWKLKIGDMEMKNILFVALLVILALSACAGGSSASIQGQWKLVSYNQIPAVPDVETTIEFKDGQMNGNVGCNGFGGAYKVKGDSIEFGPVMSTMMFCEGPIGEQEMGTLAVLQGKTSFVLDGNMLTITSADGNSVIVLEKK
jgi:heat shock protein HslJ